MDITLCLSVSLSLSLSVSVYSVFLCPRQHGSSTMQFPRHPDRRLTYIMATMASLVQQRRYCIFTPIAVLELRCKLPVLGFLPLPLPRDLPCLLSYMFALQFASVPSLSLWLLFMKVFFTLWALKHHSVRVCGVDYSCMQHTSSSIHLN